MKLTADMLKALSPAELHALANTRKLQAKDHQRAANAAHLDAKRLRAAARKRKAEQGT